MEMKALILALAMLPGIQPNFDSIEPGTYVLHFDQTFITKSKESTVRHLPELAKVTVNGGSFQLEGPAISGKGTILNRKVTFQRRFWWNQGHSTIRLIDKNKIEGTIIWQEQKRWGIDHFILEPAISSHQTR